MVELIVGKKGKGKTKVLLDKVNGAVKEANGSIVLLMYPDSLLRMQMNL